MSGRKSTVPQAAYVPCVLVMLFLAVRTTLAVPTHFMETERYRYSVDLDAEQTEARYDQGMLSDIINDNDRGELQKAESCLVDNYKYDHGQKIQRLDPCEICLCIDGEIFCWWKQCDPQSKASLDLEQEQTAESAVIIEHPAQGKAAEVSTIRNTATAANTTANDGNNGATRLLLADTLGDYGTTAISSTVAISTTSAHGLDGDLSRGDTNVHHGTTGHLQDALDGIPKNILSFPQSPPIMMYRPVSSGPTSSRERTESEGGRKPKPINASPWWEGKGKAGHKKTKERKKTPKQPADPSTKEHSFDADRKPTVSIASDALPRIVENSSGRGDGAIEPDRSIRDQSSEQVASVGIPGSGTEQENQESSPTKQLPEQEQFGGYGFGMIPEPEHSEPRDNRKPGGQPRDRDVPQHYIITSSGHVEMFDDSGTIGGPELGTENQEVTAPNTAEGYRGVLSFDGRVASPVVQQQEFTKEGTGEDSDGADSDEVDEDEGNDGGPVGPAIMLITNVTQGKYSAGEGHSSTTSSVPPSSVIDILNSTTLETDYGEGTNHSDLIYPEIPSVNGQGTGTTGSSSASSSSTTKSPPEGTAGSVAQVEPHCVVLGVTYPVGAEVKKVGLCMYCVCEAGTEYDSSPRVSCTRLNCPPLILPDMLDEAGY